jgi:hypothetical protein
MEVRSLIGWEGPQLTLFSDEVVELLLLRHREILCGALSKSELQILVEADLADESGGPKDICRRLIHHVAELDRQSDPSRLERILATPTYGKITFIRCWMWRRSNPVCYPNRGPMSVLWNRCGQVVNRIRQKNC